VEVAGGALIVPRAVLVDLGGREYRIPARPASEWMLVLLEHGWADIVPGMCEGDLDELYEDLATGAITTAECEQAAMDAVTAAAGTHWWSAVRLLYAASRDPSCMGELRSSGLDMTTAPLGAVLVTCYRIYTRDREPKDVARLDHELTTPPPGVSVVDVRYDEDAAAAAFEARFAAQGGG
jgi:hypothetical protein